MAFGAAANHCAFYPGAFPIEAHKDELKAYDTSKGTIRFQADSPLPAALVRKLVKTRIAEKAAPTTGCRGRRCGPPLNQSVSRTALVKIGWRWFRGACVTDSWNTSHLSTEHEACRVFPDLRGKRWLSRGQSRQFGGLLPSIDREPRRQLSRLQKLTLERRPTYALSCSL